jgi:hypothetical protein
MAIPGLLPEIPVLYSLGTGSVGSVFFLAVSFAIDGGSVFSHSPENGDDLRELRERLRQDSRDSLQLLKNFQDNPICSINLDEARRCITVVWKQYATKTQFRYIHENLLRLICEHRVSKILGDDTALPTIPSEDQVWVIDKWFPRAAKCGLRFAASRRPDSYFGKLSIGQIHSAAPADIECRSFDGLDEAREWLETVTAV